VYIGGVKFVVDYFANKVELTRELANVSITLTPSAPSPVYGQPETFTATLTPEPGAPVVSGQVVFTLDGTAQPAVTLVNGVATFDATAAGPLSVGPHTIQVDYNGRDAANNIVFNPASTNSNFTVSAAGTTTTLTTSIVTPIYGQDFTLKAT